MSPLKPKYVAVNWLSELRSVYQTPVDGRYTVISPLPSPSKSPVTGISPCCPQCKPENWPLPLLRKYQAPSDGRNTARSSLPSPSMSAGIGLSPEAPNCMMIKPELLLFWI